MCPRYLSNSNRCFPKILIRSQTLQCTPAISLAAPHMPAGTSWRGPSVRVRGEDQRDLPAGRCQSLAGGDGSHGDTARAAPAHGDSSLAWCGVTRLSPVVRAWLRRVCPQGMSWGGSFCTRLQGKRVDFQRYDGMMKRKGQESNPHRQVVDGIPVLCFWASKDCCSARRSVLELFCQLLDNNGLISEGDL